MNGSGSSISARQDAPAVLKVLSDDLEIDWHDEGEGR
jgi:hypothetical protein